MDKFLVREIASYGGRLTIMAKSVPILTDATLKEAEEAGLQHYGKITDNGPFGIGFYIEKVPGRVMKILTEAYFIIAKGMANYEAITEMPLGNTPVFFIMHTKCRAVAESIGLPLDRGVIKMWKKNPS